MQEKFKIISSNLLHLSGVAALLRRATAARGGIILALHRVLPLEQRTACYDRHLVLGEPAFVSLLHLLQTDYRVVPLENLLAEPRGSGSKPKVALTFDDGWEDNFRVAFPHLLANQVPATIFVCTELVGTHGVLPEERFSRIWAECAARSRLDGLKHDLHHWGIGKYKPGKIQSERRYWSQELKRVPLNARLLLLDHIERRYDVPRTISRRFLGWEDIRAMVNTGLIRIGSHTGRHASLTSETDRDIRRELADSRTTLMDKMGSLPDILAYPNGMYNRRVVELVRGAGFRYALATDSGITTPRANPLAIPRVAVDDTTVTEAGVRLSANRASVYFLSSGLRPAT